MTPSVYQSFPFTQALCSGGRFAFSIGLWYRDSIMKIEKISENQIRCTLTRDDLSSRQIRLSELAYGSEKAKKLFQDMMEEAEYTVGFNSGNAPLMIEAIPTSTDSIVLVITKVDDPEELDTRFSRFTRSEEDTTEEKPAFIGAEEVLDLFHKIYESRKTENAPTAAAKPQKERVSAPAPARRDREAVNLVQAFRFPSMDDLIAAAHSLAGVYEGANSVYTAEDREDGYLLLLHQSDYTPEAFNKVCNILSEYGRSEPVDPAREAFLAEHRPAMLADTALQTLAQLPL